MAATTKFTIKYRDSEGSLKSQTIAKPKSGITVGQVESFTSNLGSAYQDEFTLYKAYYTVTSDTIVYPAA